MSPTSAGRARSGTLPEPQVQAMFDRIAGVYDVLNSVMTGAAAVVVVLPGLVRPRRAAPRPCRGRPRRILVPPEFGSPLPRRARRGGGDGGGRTSRRPLDPDRRRHHRDPRGNG